MRHRLSYYHKHGLGWEIDEHQLGKSEPLHEYDGEDKDQDPENTSRRHKQHNLSMTPVVVVRIERAICVQEWLPLESLDTAAEVLLYDEEGEANNDKDSEEEGKDEVDVHLSFSVLQYIVDVAYGTDTDETVCLHHESYKAIPKGLVALSLRKVLDFGTATFTGHETKNGQEKYEKWKHQVEDKGQAQTDSEVNRLIAKTLPILVHRWRRFKLENTLHQLRHVLVQFEGDHLEKECNEHSGTCWMIDTDQHDMDDYLEVGNGRKDHIQGGLQKQIDYEATRESNHHGCPCHLANLLSLQKVSLVHLSG